jgi:hypothetical protein
MEYISKVNSHSVSSMSKLSVVLVLGKVMVTHQPEYSVILNNCETFAWNLAGRILLRKSDARITKELEIEDVWRPRHIIG